MKQKNKNLLLGAIFIVILAIIIFFSGIFSIISVDNGASLMFSQPGVCAQRYALSSSERTTSYGTGDTMIFGDYKLKVTYYDYSYSLSCSSGTCTRGTKNSNKAGFTYQLFHKNNVISQRIDFPMSDFYANYGEVKYSLNTICLKNEAVDISCQDYEYELSKFSSGSTDCNGKPYFIIKNRIRIPSLSESIEFEKEYQKGTMAFATLQINNPYDRPMKAKLTLRYSLETVLGTQTKPEVIEYSINSGMNEFKIPIDTSETIQNLKISPSLDIYDSGYSGASVLISNFDLQPEFWDIDEYTKTVQLSNREVKNSDYLKVRTVTFNESKISIVSKYTEDYAQFLEMTVEEQAKYLVEKDLTIEEITKKLESEGISTNLNTQELSNKLNEKTFNAVLIYGIIVLIVIVVILLVRQRK